MESARKRLLLPALLCLSWLLAAAAVASDGVEFVQPDLEDRLQSGEQIDLMLHFDMPDLSPAYEMGWEERGQWVFKQLSVAMEREQSEVRNRMLRQGADFYQLRAGNMMVVRQAGYQLFDTIRNTPNVKRIYEKPEFQIIQNDGGEDTTLGGGPTANLDQIMASDVWDQLGVTGENVVVGLNDSSPRYTHDLLVQNYRGNVGGGSFDHDYNWFDPNTGALEPFPEGHGTLVTSIMIGDDGTNQTGVAPDANWIACGGCAGGSCAGVDQCLNWMIAPTDVDGNNPDPDQRPHVVNNSWGDCSQTYDSSQEPLWDSMYAAGVMPFFSNGNSSNCGYSSPPGLNTVGNPARAGRVMGIGSTTQTGGNYATHSNWGPTDNPNPGLANGSFDDFGYPDLKPNVSAPGQGIPGAGSGSDSGTTSSTGTSFASPHATGLAALMISAAPCLAGDHQTIGSIMMETATPVPYDGGGAGDPDVEPGVNQPNYASGWGEINALAAVQAAIESCGPRGTLSGTVTDMNSSNPVEGVTVSTTDPDSNVIETTTDSSGFYSMSLPETEAGESYDIDYERNGYITTTVTGLTIADDEELTEDVALQPVAGETVSGTVTDANFPGTGVEGADLLFTDADGFTYGPATTDANGDYSIDLPPGISYDVTITADGYEELIDTIGTVNGPITADFTLDAGLIELPATATLSVDRGDTGSTTITINNTGTADAEIDLAFVQPGQVFFQDFEGSFPPAGWTLDDASTPDPCPWVSTDDTSVTDWAGTTRAAAADSDACGNGNTNDTSIITPSFDLSAASMATLNFDMAMRTGFAASETTLEVSTNGGSSWDTLDSWTSDVAYPADPLAAQTYDLSAYAGESDVSVRWRYEAGWDWWVIIDNVEVTSDAAGVPWAGVDPETVTVPQGGSVDVDLLADATNLAVGVYNAPLNVTDGSAYDVTPTDFELTVNAVPEIILPETVDITVEYPNTTTETIDVENVGGLSGDVTLDFVPSGIDEDFEGTFPPEGWTLVDNSSPACPWTTTDVTDPSGWPAGGSRAAVADSDSCGSGVVADTALISPPVDLTTVSGSISLDFDFAYRSGFAASTVTLLVSGDGGDTWDVIDSWTDGDDVAYPDDPTAPLSYDLGAYAGQSDVLIQWQYEAGWSWWTIVDNVSIQPPAPAWVQANPSLVTVPASSTVQTDLEIDSSVLPGPGVYQASMNGSVDSPFPIDSSLVTLTVEPGPDLAGINGNVESLGYCGSNPFAAGGAEIEIVGVNNTYTATADANGDYEIFIPSDETPVDITASAVNHLDSTQSGVALTPADSITVDFSLDLDEPCATTTPESMSATLEIGQTDTQTLSIENLDGAGQLDWTLEEAEPAFVNPDSGGSAGAGLASGGSNSVDMLAFFGDELPAATRVGPAGSFDCDGASGLIIHDDGSVENGYSGNPAVATDVTVVEGFEPTDESIIGTVCVALLTLGPDTRDFELVVFDDDGAGGAPGTEIAAIPSTATGIPNGIPDPIVWYTVDLTSENIVVSAGSRVYIGARYDVSDPNVFVASDENGPGGLGAGYFQTDGGAWSELGTAETFPEYSAMFVRPQMSSPSGCASPSDVSWLSLSSQSGTTAPGGSSDVDVVIDSSGLSPGDYEATICVNSNDPENPIVPVPVSLTTTAPPSFASVSGTVQTLGYCSSNPAPAAGASVEIVSGAQTYNLTADGSGFYELFLDSAEGPVDVTATAPDHDTQVVTDVALTASQNSTVDFDLVLQASCATVTPSSITDSVGAEQVVDYTVTVGNTDGAVDLEWALDVDVPAAAYESGLPEADEFVPAPMGWDRASGQSTAERDGRSPVAKAGLQGGAIGEDFSEAFDDIATLPGAGWSLQNLSDPLGTSDWFQGNPDSFPAHEGATDAYIGANFNNTTGGTGTISNWLITPEVELNEGAVLTFWSRTATDTQWADRLEVRMSTAGSSTDVGTGATDVGDFDEVLLTINENQEVTGYPETWTEYTVEITGVPSGTTGRIGFRYFVTQAGPDGTNSNYIGIDTFSFDQPAACVDPAGASWISVDTMSGTVGAGGTQDVQVTVDGAELSNGTNEGFLCFTTDDLNNEQIVVPLTIDAAIDIIFGDRFEQ